MIAIDAVSNGAATTASPLTWSHTCTGSNLVLIVGFEIGGSTGSQTVTGVTYNGVAMTQIGSALSNGGSSANISMWYLLNPSTGSNTISATLSSIITTNGIAMSFTGVSAFGSTVTNSNTAATISTSITPTVTGSLAIDVAGTNAAGNPTLSATSGGIIKVSTTNNSANAVAMNSYFPTIKNNPITFSYSAAGTGPSNAHRIATFTPTGTYGDHFVANNIRPRAFAPGLAR